MKFFLKLKIKKLFFFLNKFKGFLIIEIFRRFPGVKRYQPIYNAKESLKVTRACLDRWKVIQKKLPLKKKSVLDIGSNIGFFTFKFAENNFLAHGIESDILSVLVSESIKQKNQVQNVFFSLETVDEVFIKKMPKYQIVNNLSVFHHWVKRYGDKKALRMLSYLVKHCDYMFFETGQVNEVDMEWSKLLKFMKNDPESWVINTLKKFGFRDVLCIGQFNTGLSNVKRNLFFAKK
ncbi:MAG: hypothetical protein CMP38_00510 [Rickettsiales bacterium]|nr:hypothetical protein [Rickettsiales bacterium]|tara:strand:+ start:326 stop:1027 length:702 start_codon:yes stop_codon:yes gene_type:complete